MREGRVVQCDTPMAVYDRPATSLVGSFIGNPPKNLLRGRREGVNGHRRVMIGDQAFEAPPELGGATGSEVEVGIRAENIEAITEQAPGALAARADVIEPLGSNLLITAVVGESGQGERAPQRIKIQTHIDFPVRADQPLWLRPEPGKLRWFDVETGREVVTA